MSERRRLINLAYRLLGSLAEADLAQLIPGQVSQGRAASDTHVPGQRACRDEDPAGG